ncbi:MAG: Gfo/Idh/MocA family oxidoreductase [Chloroflexota bacterium]
MKTIRWGIIGVGDVTEIKSGPAFYKADHSQLVAVMRRSGDKARDYSERHHVPRWYDDGDALIRDSEVDVVYIATPPDTHESYTLKAAAAGKPVYCEKPMARNYAECQRMIEACKQVNVPLWVAYYRRAMPRFVKIKELVDSKSIGDIRAVSIRLYKKADVPPNLPANELPWRVVPKISGGGHFVDLAAHQIDFLNYVLGSVESVAGRATNQEGLYPAEDTVSAAFQYPSGVLGSGVWCFSAGYNLDEIMLVGTQGTLSFATFDVSPVMLTTNQGTQSISLNYPQHVHQPLVETIIAELNGQGKCPSTGETAARTSWFIDEVLKSYSSR